MKALRSEISHILHGKFIFQALIMPLIVATIFGYLFNNSQINQGRIAVIDEDNSGYSHELVSLLDASQYIQVADVFHQIMAPDKLLYNEDYLAIVYLPRELEQNRLQGKQTNIGLLVDCTVPANSADLRGGINEVIATQNNVTSMGRLKAMGMNAEQASGISTNLSLQQRLLYNPTNDFMNLMVIGFVNIIALSLLTMQTVHIIPRLRSEKMLANELKDPLGLLTRAIPYSVVSGLTLFFTIGILKQVGGFRFVGNPFQFLLPLFLYTLTSSLLGMLLGWTAKSPKGAMTRGLGLVITSFFLSGVQTPVALFPQPIQAINKLLPLTWNFKFIRGMGLRGGDIGYFKPEIGVFLIMIAVILLLHIINIIRERQKSYLQLL